MPFDVDLFFAQCALAECVKIVENLTNKGHNVSIVGEYSNGIWERVRPNYFDCGCNERKNQPPAYVGDKGRLGSADGARLEQWYLDYCHNHNQNVPDGGQPKAYVLKQGDKWNFVLVANGSAMNFHMIVRIM
jgi:hypothetical protein